MRLRRLDLTRYGVFTDFSLDFGPHNSNATDLHIIYGPNEAGKSTALSAFLDLLFGIESQSRYAFKHSYATMQIGACIEVDSEAYEFKRIKRRQNSLLNKADQPLEASMLNEVIAGLSRDDYRTMFSLDDDTLEAGGESILASKGNLGELLFSGSAGVADIGQVLRKIETEAAEIYKPGGTKNEINQLKVELKGLDSEIKSIDTAAIKFSALISARNMAKEQYDNALNARSATQYKIEQLIRYGDALPRLTELRSLRIELAAMPTLPIVPKDWLAGLPELRNESIQIGVQLEDKLSAVTALSSEIESITIDPVVNYAINQLEELNQLRERYRSTTEDAPALNADISSTRTDMRKLLRKLDLPDATDPTSLIFNEWQVSSLEQLIREKETLDIELSAATQELQHARQALNALDGLDIATVDLKESDSLSTLHLQLKTFQTEIRQKDLLVQEKSARTQVQICEATFNENLQSLAPWDLGVGELRDMQAPPIQTVERWKKNISEIEATLKVLEQEHAQKQSDCVRYKSQIDAVIATTGVVEGDEAQRIRSQRDLAWSKHVKQLTQQTAKQFEEWLEQDDLVMRLQVEHATDVATLNQNRRELLAAQALVQQTVCTQTQLNERLIEIRSDISAKLGSIPSPLLDSKGILEIQEWLEKRTLTLLAHDELLKAEKTLREIEGEISSAKTKLLGILNAIKNQYTSDTDLAYLLIAADEKIEQMARDEGKRTQLKQYHNQVDLRQNNLKKIKKSHKQWARAWNDACESTWIKNLGHSISTDAAKKVLNLQQHLTTLIEREERLTAQQSSHERYIQDYENKVVAIGKRIGLEVNIAIDLLSNQIREIIDHENAQSSKLDELQTRLKQEQGLLQGLQSRAKTNKKQVAAITQLLSVDSIHDAEPLLNQIDKQQDLITRCNTLEDDLKKPLGVATMDKVEDAIGKLDPIIIETKLGELRKLVEQQDIDIQELHTSLRKAEDAVSEVNGDATVANLKQQRQTLLLVSQDRLTQYFKLKTGIIAIERALKIYRDKYRSDMMVEASDAFCIISGGAYTKLDTQDGETLLGVSRDGTSKHSLAMSKGTRCTVYRR